MCSGPEAGSYSRLIDFVYHSTLGLRVIKKKIGAYRRAALRAWKWYSSGRERHIYIYIYIHIHTFYIYIYIYIYIDLVGGYRHAALRASRWCSSGRGLAAATARRASRTPRTPPPTRAPRLPERESSLLTTYLSESTLSS